MRSILKTLHEQAEASFFRDLCKCLVETRRAQTVKSEFYRDSGFRFWGLSPKKKKQTARVGVWRAAEPSSGVISWACAPELYPNQVLNPSNPSTQNPKSR